MSLSTKNPTVGPVTPDNYQPTSGDNNTQEGSTSKKVGLQESKWALPDFDPVKARKARGLPGTYKEEQEMSMLWNNRV